MCHSCSADLLKVKAHDPFVLIGEQLPAIVSDLEGYPAADVLLYAALAHAAVLVTRFAWFFSMPYLHPLFDRLLRNRYLRAPGRSGW